MLGLLLMLKTNQKVGIFFSDFLNNLGEKTRRGGALWLWSFGFNVTQRDRLSHVRRMKMRR